MTPKNPNRIIGLPLADRITCRLFRRRWLAALLAAIVLTGACRSSSESTLQRASEAWDNGDYEQSAELYEEHLEHNPDGESSQRARFKLANTYFANLRRYDRAASHYREYLNQAPLGDPEGRVVRERLAESLSELGRSYEAIAEYENIAPAHPSDRRRIRLRIADIYFDQKNYSQALTEYSKITDNAPYDEFSENAYLREASIYQLERKQYQQALPIYQKLESATADPKVRTRALFNIGDCYESLFQFEEAIKAYREIKDPKEQPYITRRIAELEQRSREAAHTMATSKSMMR
jgi:tetratricopeptide (TPR) repeat protein